MPTKKVSKSDALKALENILDNGMMNNYLHAEDIITITRFIEQQWESEEQIKVTAKSEGTI